MIDFEWYRSFVAVYRVGTVSGAAVARLLTQPAVSQHLAALEAAAGELLFRRTPRRMEPTERGKELYSQVAQAVDSLEQMAEQIRRVGKVERPLLRLGAAAAYFEYRALPRLGRAKFRLRVLFGLTERMLDELARGELDVVIATQRLPMPTLEYVKLAEERFLLVGGPELLASAKVLEGSELNGIEVWLREQSWISYGTELPIIRRFWQQSFGHRPNLIPAMIIPDLTNIARAVALGYGLSLLPDYMCGAEITSGQLGVVWQPPQPVVNELWLAYRRIDHNESMIEEVRTVLLAE